MLKLKCSDSVKLRGFVKEFGEKYFTTDGIILFCKLCKVKVTAEKCFTAEKHCHTASTLTAKHTIRCGKQTAIVVSGITQQFVCFEQCV
jgi:hypothetical protein